MGPPKGKVFHPHFIYETDTNDCVLHVCCYAVCGDLAKTDDIIANVGFEVLFLYLDLPALNPETGGSKKLTNPIHNYEIS